MKLVGWRIGGVALPLLAGVGCTGLTGTYEVTSGVASGTSATTGSSGGGGLGGNGGQGGQGARGGGAGHGGQGGRGGDAGHGGAGGMELCMPGKTMPCYDGPPGTEGVGTCKSGLSTCMANGSGFGPCTGEVVPAMMDDCTTMTDNTCDGMVDCVCVPASMAACYDGPPGTEGVGTCVGGMKACNADGTAYGVCMGEVLPAAMDDCVTMMDSNCDGKLECACTPNASGPCYDGPPGTEGVGTCVGGMATCNAAGTAYGPCTGEVTPAPTDDCATGMDTACDGTSCGEALWSGDYGDALSQQITAVAADAAGNVYLAGEFLGTLTFGNTTLICAGHGDAFLVKLNASGAFLWGLRFGDAPNSQRSTAVAVDSTGNVFLAGTFEGSMVVGNNTLMAGTGFDAFVAKFDTSGNPLWSFAYGDGSDEDGAFGIAVDPQNNALVAGTFSGTINLGNGVLTATGFSDIFVAKLSGATGAGMWSKHAGAASQYSDGNAVAVDSSGNVVVGGHNQGAFVERLDTAGNVDFSQTYGTGTATVNGIAVDSMGSLLITGSTGGTSISFGGGVIDGSAFVAKLNTIGGYTWGLGATALQGLGVAVDASNNVFATGQIDGTANFGGGSLMGGGFLLKLGESGGYLWSRAYGGGSAFDSCLAVAVAPTGEVLLGCDNNSTMNFGNGPLTTAGQSDVTIAKIASK
jgi:hypothetical protein